MRMFIPGCLLLSALVGCGSLNTSEPPAASTAVPTASQQPGFNYPPDPISVVQSFLSGLQIDPSGGVSTNYLDPVLSAEIAAGRPLAVLLGTSEPFEWFEVAPFTSELAPGSVAVQATLHFKGHTETRKFSLADQGAGRWQITDLGQAGSTEEPPGGGIRLAPQTFAASFISAVMGSSPVDTFLAPSLRRELDQGAAPLALLALPEPTDVYTIELTAQTPQDASVAVYFSSSSGPLTRTLELQSTADGAWQVQMIR